VGRNSPFEKSEPICEAPNKQKQGGCGDVAQSGPRKQAGAHCAIGAAQYILQDMLCAIAAGMTAGGCAVLAGQRAVERGTQGHVRQSQPAVRCGRRQAWRARCACPFGGTMPGTPAGAVIPASVFRAAALAFRRAACRPMSTHGRISSHYPTSAPATLVPRHSGTRLFVLPSFARKLVWALPHAVLPAQLCDARHLTLKLWKIARNGCAAVGLLPS
jgi:hypothetical protein